MLKPCLATIPLLFVISCVPATQVETKPQPVDGQEICDGTRETRAKVVEDLLASSDDALASSAGKLVVLIDAGCAN